MNAMSSEVHVGLGRKGTRKEMDGYIKVAPMQPERTGPILAGAEGPVFIELQMALRHVSVTWRY